MATKIRGNSQIMAGTIDSAKLEENFLKGKTLTLSDDNTAVIAGLAAPTAAQHAATKAYVDSVATGLDVKKSVRAATTPSGGNISSLYGTMTIDGVSLIAGDRVLVKDQTDKSQNGIYVVATEAWARSTDADNQPNGGEVTSGMFTFVEEGTINANCGFVITTPDPIVLDTTNIEFGQFSGAGAYTAGDGLDLSGVSFSVDVTDFIDGNYGLTENANDIRVNLATSGGLKFDSGAIAIEPSDFIDTTKGLAESGDDIYINLDSTPGLQFNGGSGALSVKAGDGVTIDSYGVKIDLASNKGLSLTASDGTGKLQIVSYDGITIDSNGVQVALTTDGGLEFTGTAGSKTIGVKIGSGIQLTSGAVTAKVYDGIENNATNGLTIRLTTNGGLVLDTAASGSKGIMVSVDASTIEINTSGQLRVKDSGIVESKIGTGAVTSTKIAADAVNTTHIDWGTGTNQIDASDIPFTPDSGSGFATGTDTVSEALNELAVALGSEVNGEEPTVTAGNAAVAALAAPDSGKAIDSDSLKVYLNGLRCAKGSGKDYTYNSTTRVITFEYNLASGDVVLVDYKIINAVA